MRRLRVGVRAALLDGAMGGGHGRVWREVLRGLEGEGVRLVTGRRADVWLGDGHADVDGLGEPLVVQVHEAPWDDPLLDPGFAAGMAQRTQAAVDAATRVITASEHARAEIEAAHGARAVDVVAHGVDGTVFRPMAPEGARVPYVLFVGTVHPRKNLPALKDAVRAVQRDRELELRCVLSPAPDRADSTTLFAAAGAEPSRDRPGDAELAQLLAGAAVVCVPSRSEGFGLTALEAMACGAPVVAGDRGALPEVTGGAAVLVEPEPEAIAAGLRAVLDDPARAAELRAAGLRRAGALTWAATAAGWRRSLERAAQR